MNNVLEMVLEELEEVNECFETRGQDVFNKLYKLKRRRLAEFMARMTNDLHMVKTLGFITEDERKKLDHEMHKVVELALAKHRTAQVERIGEHEYEILWLMDDMGLTREEAEAKYEWLNTLD